jgi:hypothetical protein
MNFTKQYDFILCSNTYSAWITKDKIMLLFLFSVSYDTIHIFFTSNNLIFIVEMNTWTWQIMHETLKSLPEK